MSLRGSIRAGQRGADAEMLSTLAEPFAAIEKAARERPLEDLPELEGWLGRIRGLISVRYVREPRAAIPTPTAEHLLGVEEAAARLSKTPDWLYHHHRTLPFAVKVGAHLRFSESGLNSWIREQTSSPPPARRHLLAVKP